MGGMAEPARADLRDALGAWRRHLRNRRFDRDEALARLDAVHARRGAANPARVLQPAKVSGAAGAPDLHLEVAEPTSPRADAATIIFAPGTNAYVMLYAELLATLAARGVRAIGFDPRGHGGSGGSRGSYVVQELVDDMDRVVQWARARFDGPIFVAGSSQGGITAFYYASRNGPIAGAICHNAADLGDDASLRLTRWPPSFSRGMAPALRALARRLPELPVPMTAYLDLGRERVDGLGSARDVIYLDPFVVPFVRLRALASLSHAPLDRPVEEIRVPVMLLHAGDDTIFPEDLIRGLHDRLPGPKRLLVYDGLPHYVVVDHVPRVVEDVVQFIDDVLKGRLA
jgi:alpha-beta hydrolase superfamily lysophospholipase